MELQQSGAVCGVENVDSAGTPELCALLNQFGRNGSLSAEQYQARWSVVAELGRRLDDPVKQGEFTDPDLEQLLRELNTMGEDAAVIARRVHHVKADRQAASVFIQQDGFVHYPV